MGVTRNKENMLKARILFYNVPHSLFQVIYISCKAVHSCEVTFDNVFHCSNHPFSCICCRKLLKSNGLKVYMKRLLFCHYTHVENAVTWLIVALVTDKVQVLQLIK